MATRHYNITSCGDSKAPHLAVVGVQRGHVAEGVTVPVLESLVLGRRHEVVSAAEEADGGDVVVVGYHRSVAVQSVEGKQLRANS